MNEQNVNADERVRALRRRALLAERLLLDLGGADDRDMAAGMLVQALTTIAGSDSAELLSWADGDVRRVGRSPAGDDEVAVSAVARPLRSANACLSCSNAVAPVATSVPRRCTSSWRHWR